MAGSSSNWFKLSSGPKKGTRVFISNATIDGIIPKKYKTKTSIQEFKKSLQFKLDTQGQHLQAESLAAKSPQPGGQAKKGGAIQAQMRIGSEPTRGVAHTPESAGQAAVTAGFPETGGTLMRLSVKNGLVARKDVPDVIAIGKAALAANGAPSGLSSAHLAEAVAYKNLAGLRRTAESGPNPAIRERASTILAIHNAGVADAFVKVGEGKPISMSERAKILNFAGYKGDSEARRDAQHAQSIFADRVKISQLAADPASGVVKVKGGYAVRHPDGSVMPGVQKTKKAAVDDAQATYETLLASNGAQLRQARKKLDKLPNAFVTEYTGLKYRSANTIG